MDFLKKKPANFELASFSNLGVWSRRESNPRPNISAESFLHAYLRIVFSRHGKGRN